MLRIGLTIVLLTSCGGETSEGLPTGATCMTDVDCASGLCWDFTAHDPLCAGKICSITCETSSECVAVALEAGAGFPNSASCGSDFQCAFVGTGLGEFVCQ